MTGRPASRAGWLQGVERPAPIELADPALNRHTRAVSSPRHCDARASDARRPPDLVCSDRPAALVGRRVFKLVRDIDRYCDEGRRRAIREGSRLPLRRRLAT